MGGEKEWIEGGPLGFSNTEGEGLEEGHCNGVRESDRVWHFWR